VVTLAAKGNVRGPGSRLGAEKDSVRARTARCAMGEHVPSDKLAVP
jgi:hypothetical protein